MAIRFLSRKSYVSAIDVGSHQVRCWIGLSNIPREGEKFTVLGSGVAETSGFFGGEISDFPSFENAMHQAIREAEKSSGLTVRESYVTLSGGFISERIALSVDLAEGIVTPADVDGLIQHPSLERQGYYPLHVIPVEFCVDQQRRIQDPTGMIGKALSVLLHVIYISKATLNILQICARRCRIGLRGIVFSGYSSSLATLVPDEMDLGCMLVDLGRGGTTVCSFHKKNLVGSFYIPIGGELVTKDIARGLETSLVEAEKLKLFYGAAIHSQDDYREVVAVRPLGGADDETVQMPRSFLVSVVQARIEEIFLHVKEKVAQDPSAFSTVRIILTGGGSRLSGVRELVQRMFNGYVRVAGPLYVEDIPTTRSELSALAGLFSYARKYDNAHHQTLRSEKTFIQEMAKPFSSWLKRNF